MIPDIIDDTDESGKLLSIQIRLDECRRKLAGALGEIEERFPKSIFGNPDMSVEDEGIDMNESEFPADNETTSQTNPATDDPFSEGYDIQSSVPETSPPSSPPPFKREPIESESNYGDSISQTTPLSPRHRQSSDGSRPTIRAEMMKLFKITTGGDGIMDRKQAGASGNRDLSDVIPVVTSVPRDRMHSLLLLFRLELPKSMGIVSRIAVNQDGYIAGCTVHGEIFAFTRLPYSRFPDSVTRGHDGGIVSLTFLSGPELGRFIISNGVDRKTLVWQVTPDRGMDGPCYEIRQPAVPTCCCIHPINKDIIVMGLLDNTLAMYKVEKTIESGDPLVRLVALGIGATLTKPITALSICPDGRRMAVGSSVGTVGFLDLNTMSIEVEVDCRNRQGKTSSGRKVVGLHWSRDSTCVVVSSCDSRVRVVLVSDLSRRTKFKSHLFVNENLFLASTFGPPDDGRIAAVSESGHLCMWKLHTSSKTNENCLHCNLIAGGVVAKINQEKQTSASTEITASAIVQAGDPFCEAIQAKTFNLGDSFRRGTDMAFVVCDTSGAIRIFTELFAGS